MNFLKSAGRPLLLFALFVLGAALIWHIGHDLSSAKENRIAPAVRIQTETPAAPAGASAAPISGVKAVLPEGSSPQPLKTDRGRFIATDPILFNSGASTMREASLPQLDNLAGFLIRNPEIRLEIIGHTDNLGPEPVNQQVSVERAAIVMHYLLSQGIDPSRLQSKGMGSLDPIESNDTQLGRQANRRIEFLIREGAAAGPR